MLVSLESISKTYGQNGRQVNALDNVDFTLDTGEFVAIQGPSGCGKSTLLMTLGGLLRPNHGNVLIDGTSVYSISANERAALRARTIGYVFQQFHLVPYLSIFDNVMAARIGKGAAEKKQYADRAEALIDQFGLSDRKSHRPGQLSTGERQRTALARALLNSPKLLVADEPTGNLDQKNAESVLQHMSEFAKNGGAVLLVTHDDRAAESAQQVRHMKDGNFVE